MCQICKVGFRTSYVLAAVGAINWGLTAFLKFNLVYFLNNHLGNFGLDKILYALISLAGIYLLIVPLLKKYGCCKK